MRTMVKVDAKKSSIGKRIEVYEISFALFDFLAFEG